MLECRLRAYASWNKPTADQRAGTFKVGYSKLLEDLSYELEKLDASDIVLQLGIAESKVRTARRSYDGWPKADTRTVMPGVVLSFETWGKPLEFRCDTYTDWMDNLRAISLTLSALRAVERYGAVKQQQQYRGWEALPPALEQETFSAVPNPTAPDAAQLLERQSSVRRDQILADPEAFKRAYREASMKNHTDRGGDNAAQTAINAASEILKRRHGL